MTFEEDDNAATSAAVDDIEDMLGSSSESFHNPIKRSSSLNGDHLNSQQQSVRIRRINNKKKKSLSVSDCEGGDGNCSSNGSSCGCQFPEGEEDKNSSLSESVPINDLTATKTDEGQLTSNDLNPASHTIYLKTWGCSHNNSDSEYMAGLLAAAGYNVTTTDTPSTTLTILNSCTVKGPSEQHFRNEINRTLSQQKHLILAGCVPQSDKSYRKLGASVIGVQQIDRIVEVVEETLRGNKVCFVSANRKGGRSAGADLALPKIRKNELVEIVPVSSGCLNNCTYCKTKLARGQLRSYSIDSIVSRISYVTSSEGVKEIWLTSEDLGAWGIDIGLTIVDLLNAIVEAMPPTVMLRLGMTNPPYILDHLEEISKILHHPNVYEFLHIPVQSGSDSVLLEMKREYGRKDFERICDFMLERHPNITLATDIICGYPTETDADFTDTYTLVEKYRFPVLFINQFYPRPGTPAARLKRLPTDLVKSRTRVLNELFQSYTNLTQDLIGSVQRVLVTEIAHDGVKLVGHNKFYQQVLIDGIKDVDKPEMMGKWVDVKVNQVGKFSMIGVVRPKINLIHAIISVMLILLCFFFMKL